MYQVSKRFLAGSFVASMLAHPDTIVMIACSLRWLLIVCSLPQNEQLAVFVQCGTKVDRPTDIDMLYFGGTARCIDVQ